MPDTTIKIRGDTTGLKEIGRETKTAFSPTAIQNYQRVTKSLQGDIKRLKQEQALLTKELLNVERGTKAYNSLRVAIRNVSDEAKLAKVALEGLNKSVVRGVPAPTGSPSVSPPSITTPTKATGPTQAQQYRHARWLREQNLNALRQRGFGPGVAMAATAPFRQPGIGGLTSMLGAVPFVGGAMAGALMQGAGYFQEATAFQRARLQNLQYVNTMAGIRTGYVNRAIPMGAVAPPLSPVKQVVQTGAELGAGYVGGKVLQYAQKRGISAWDIAKEGIGWTGIGGLGAAYAMERGREAIESGDLERALRGQAVSSALKRRAAGTPIKPTIAPSPQFRKVPTTLLTGPVEIPGAGFGASMGFGAQEVQQLFGQFMGARGGFAQRGTLGQFEQTLAMQRLFGVGAGMTGQYMRQFKPGAGGTRGPGTGIADTIAIALEQGLGGSQIREYLQGILEATTAMEKEGIKFNVRDITQSSLMLRAVGLQGLQSGRVASGLQAAARGVSARGVQGPLDLLMARAAGFRPEGGAESYATAMNVLSGGMTPDIMENFLGTVTSGVRGFGPQMQQMLVRRAMKRAGVAIAPRQAQMLLSGFQGGRLTPEARARLTGMIGGAQERAGAGFVGAAQAGAARVGGLAVTAAGMEAERIGVGAQMAPLMVSLQKTSISVVRAMVPLAPAFTEMSNQVQSFVVKMSQHNDIIGKILERMVKESMEGSLFNVVFGQK